ncbi:hypothetical protein HZA57_01450 [Candidatus Poribacteria bacterium]|nr:hypothetical protein [Candidatus Poribacteria bacterium]
MLRPAHLLIALIRAGKGMGYQLLLNRDLNPVAMLADAQQLLDPPNPRPSESPPGREEIQHVLESAEEIALSLGHDWTDSAHLLLAMLKARDSPVGEVLARHGVLYEDTFAEWKVFIG